MMLREVGGMWDVAYGGQDGLGDVVLHPDFSANKLVNISSVERSRGRSWAGARLDRSGDVPVLRDPQVVWEQSPPRRGKGHFSHRIAFAPDGMLFITSGDRQAQDFDAALGKVIRLHDDSRCGTAPRRRPW